MMKARQAYLELRKRQQKEVEDFPVAYAFSEQQLEEALQKLNATKEECVSIFGCGDVLKKENVPAFKQMMARHAKELREAIKNKEFAEAAFLYEMDNHEYAINWTGDADVLGCFSLDWKTLEELNLVGAYNRARKQHIKNAEKCGMI